MKNQNTLLRKFKWLFAKTRLLLYKYKTRETYKDLQQTGKRVKKRKSEIPSCIAYESTGIFLRYAFVEGP